MRVRTEDVDRRGAPLDGAPLLDYFEAQQRRAVWRRVVLGASLVVNVLLAVAMVVPALRGLPIYYIPSGGPGVAPPGVITDGYATDYVARWMRARFSFTPETIEAVHREILPTLLPSVRERWRLGAKDEVRKVRTAQVSTQWTLTEVSVLRREGREVLVLVRGVRVIYVKRTLIREEDMGGVLGLVPWVGEGHERGVMVSRVELTPKTLGELGE